MQIPRFFVPLFAICDVDDDSRKARPVVLVSPNGEENNTLYFNTIKPKDNQTQPTKENWTIMTRAHILNTWNQPEGRRGSDRAMPNTNSLGASACQRMAVLKVVLACLTVSMGYYYASSEAMLVKYSTPKIYNAGSRSTAVLDIPKISSAQQQLQQRQHMLPERSGIDRIETVSTNDITAQVLPKQDHDKYQESKTTAIVKELAALYEPAAQETHDTTSSNNQCHQVSRGTSGTSSWKLR